MKETIKRLIQIADQTEDTDAQLGILEEIKNLIEELAGTYNCPSNWRDIGEELAKEYNTEKYNYIYEILNLWNYEE